MVRTRLKRSAEWLLVGAGAPERRDGCAGRRRSSWPTTTSSRTASPRGHRSLHLRNVTSPGARAALSYARVVPITELLEPDTRGTVPGR